MSSLAPPTNAVPDTNPSDPHLEGILRILRNIDERVQRLVDRLHPDELWSRPEAGSWSVGECLEHLITTHQLYQPVLEQGITAAHQAGWQGTKPFRHTLFGRFFVSSVGPDGKMRMRAPKRFAPSAPEPAAVTSHDVDRRFAEAQEDLRRFIRRSDGLNLNRARVRNPLIRVLSFNLGEALLLLAVHQQRHLLQAERAAPAKAA